MAHLFPLAHLSTRMQMLFSTRALAATALFAAAAAFSAGQYSCVYDTPGHPGTVALTTGKPTFTFKKSGTAATTYTAGQTGYTLTMAAPSGSTFKGFIVGDFPSATVPTQFSAAKLGRLSGTGSQAQNACTFSNGTAAPAGRTHLDATIKTTVTFNWTPPAVPGTGPVTFYAVVVKDVRRGGGLAPRGGWAGGGGTDSALPPTKTHT